MRVLGIDPGYDRMGIGIVELHENQNTVIHSQCIETDSTKDLADRLHTIGTTVETLLQQHKPDAVAIETLFFNKNVKTAIGVAQARGVLLYITRIHNLPVYEFGPQEIKIAITGYGNSDKTAVTNFLSYLVKEVPEKALDDEYDAIAVGLTCLAHYGNGV
jgi:crossover junction endodeoxyribonuclease RuvC